MASLLVWGGDYVRIMFPLNWVCKAHFLWPTLWEILSLLISCGVVVYYLIVTPPKWGACPLPLYTSEIQYESPQNSKKQTSLCSLDTLTSCL